MLFCPAGEQFSFGTPGNFEFTFGGVRGPQTPKSPVEQISESEPDEVEEDDGDHIHFQVRLMIMMVPLTL